MKSILITGGAGFVGSNLAIMFKKAYPDLKVVAFDNLRRRGSELNLKLFQELEIDFVHGDIRNSEDFSSLNETFDLFIEASAEPSVHAGINESTKYLIDTNLYGTYNCLEFARNNARKFIFLSTSRVYSIESLKNLDLVEGELRFKNNGKDICEEFSTKGFRSLYGTTKLASELLIEEYSYNFGMNSIINRCGVIAGPGQWGKVDQGVYSLWVARHFFKKKLKYTGFGGKGIQVRDLLHPKDLYRLISLQSSSKKNFKGDIFNVGGGLEVSTSLLEYSKVCEEVTGNQIEISSDLNTAEVDIPYYVSQCDKVQNEFSWKPEESIQSIVSDIFHWLKENELKVKNLF